MAYCSGVASGDYTPSLLLALMNYSIYQICDNKRIHVRLLRETLDYKVRVRIQL